MSVAIPLYIGSDSSIEIDALKDPITAAFVNDATGTAELKNPAGDVVTNGGSITLSYIASSEGDYRGTLPDNAAINDGSSSGDGPDYWLEVLAESTGRTKFWRFKCRAKYRGAG